MTTQRRSPRVTVGADAGDTPSRAIIQGANKIAEVEDALGRKLKVKKLTALAKYDLSKLVGADSAANPNVMGPAAIAYSVVEIDGDQVMTPVSEAEIRALIGRLDDEGLEAAGQAHIDQFGMGSPDDLKNG